MKIGNESSGIRTLAPRYSFPRCRCCSNAGSTDELRVVGSETTVPQVQKAEAQEHRPRHAGATQLSCSSTGFISAMLPHGMPAPGLAPHSLGAICRSGETQPTHQVFKSAKFVEELADMLIETATTAQLPRPKHIRPLCGLISKVRLP